jgi:hypothetical protein
VQGRAERCDYVLLVPIFRLTAGRCIRIMPPNACISEPCFGQQLISRTIRPYRASTGGE